MALSAGTRLGSYEILGALGAGGMGEVYRAHDSKLDRDVALKILPPHLAADPDARARFEREAKAVAALSHPNILSIHDFGTESGTAFAVTELLEGETLRARITEGPLPPKTTLRIATDIAQGLAAAHDKQIVHRDLKPENIFIATDGRVKILDFGLARQMKPATASASDSPTELRATDPGAVMGTVGYMSPEQVKGMPADQRSDIFSLGCVIFEMATGRAPFRRDTAAETMTAILREDPPSFSSAAGTMPPSIDHIVRHCLEKRPEERFQSARDLAFALQTLSGGAISSGATPVLSQAPRRRIGVMPLVAGAIIVIAAAFLAGRYLTAGRPSSAGSAVLSFDQVSDGPGVETSPTLSPDGKTVVFVSASAGNMDLYSVRVGGRNPVPLTADSKADDLQPAFSPDGERIAFRSERDGGGLFVMGATGESVKRLSAEGFSPSWSPDGREIVFAHSTFTMPTDRSGLAAGLSIVDVASGKVRVALKGADAVQPSWSPHGTRIAYWGLRGGGQRDLWTVAADGSEAETGGVSVTNDAAVDWSPAWSPDGRTLYFSSNRGGTMNLWRVAIDETSGRTLAEPEALTTPSTWSGYYSISHDGTRIAFASLDWRSTLFKVPFDAARAMITGPPVPILKSTRPIRDHQLSPDGQWVAFNETGKQEDILVARMDGTQYRRLTDDAFRDRAPVWSPDSQRVAFYSDRSGRYQLWTMRIDGTGLEQVPTEQDVNFPVWSPDGHRIAFSTLAVGGQGWRIIDLTSPASPVVLQLALEGGAVMWPLSWSPDGTRLAGNVRRSSGVVYGLAVFTIATGKYQDVPGLSGWQAPIWLSDSKRLIVRDDHGLWLVDPNSPTRRLLLSVGGYVVGRSVGVSHDDKWITYTETGTEGDIWMATLKK